MTSTKEGEGEQEQGRGEAYEAEHVHAVYEQIASHFSSTRYKPWPIVERFLKSLPPGSVGLDVGCGNGKYLGVNPDVFIVGSDRSTNLAHIARTRPSPHSHDVVVADTLALPHPAATFDFALSIAVVHHLSTPARRVDAVRKILAALRPPGAAGGAGPDAGRALVYVWALEQKDSRRGWDAGHAQDVMVPWVMKGRKETAVATGKKKGKRRKDAEEGDSAAQATGESRGKEKPQEQDGKEAEPESEQSTDQVFQRYYHLYRRGELERDVEQAGGRVLEAGYERDNWWAIVAPAAG